MRILLVEDDPITAQSIEKMLQSASYAVNAVDLGEDGLQIGKSFEYDLIILDLMLPDIDGYEVLKRLRESKIATPVLILSGLTKLDNKVLGLGYGADDYLTKPFQKRELLARVEAIIRRSKGQSDPIVRIGPIKINTASKSVFVHNHPVNFTKKEYGVIELLAMRQGRILGKEIFMTHLYDGQDEPDAKIIDVFIYSIRKKFAAVMNGNGCIETVWGRGYIIRDDLFGPTKLPAHHADTG